METKTDVLKASDPTGMPLSVAGEQVNLVAQWLVLTSEPRMNAHQDPGWCLVLDFAQASLWDILRSRIVSFTVEKKVGVVFLIRFSRKVDPVMPMIPPSLIKPDVRQGYIKLMSALVSRLELVASRGHEAIAEDLAHLAELAANLTAYATSCSGMDLDGAMFWYSQLRITAANPARLGE